MCGRHVGRIDPWSKPVWALRGERTHGQTGMQAESQIDEYTHRRMDGLTDGLTDGQTDGRTD